MTRQRPIPDEYRMRPDTAWVAHNGLQASMSHDQLVELGRTSLLRTYCRHFGRDAELDAAAVTSWVDDLPPSQAWPLDVWLLRSWCRYDAFRHTSPWRYRARRPLDEYPSRAEQARDGRVGRALNTIARRRRRRANRTSLHVMDAAR